MNDEDRKTLEWHERQAQMFGTEGWKDLVERAQAQVEQLQDIRHATAATIEFRKGQLNVLDWIVNWQDLCSQTHDYLLEEIAISEGRRDDE